MNAEPVARPHPEPVVLDIGGDLGALVVYADAALLDTPVEISPEGQDKARAHQHVLERPLRHLTHHAAVFDQVIEGTYTLSLNNKPRATDVTITGGEVTELDWRSQSQSGSITAHRRCWRAIADSQATGVAFAVHASFSHERGLYERADPSAEHRGSRMYRSERHGQQER